MEKKKKEKEKRRRREKEEEDRGDAVHIPQPVHRPHIEHMPFFGLNNERGLVERVPCWLLKGIFRIWGGSLENTLNGSSREGGGV